MQEFLKKKIAVQSGSVNRVQKVYLEEWQRVDDGSTLDPGEFFFIRQLFALLIR